MTRRMASGMTESPEASGVPVIRGDWADESPGTGSGTEGSATIGAGMFGTVEESFV
jgi:hypothetical protein